MCIETFTVSGLDSDRDAYEIKEYLRGHPDVETADVDFLEGTVTIDYDESKIDRDQVLDEIEYAGCCPAERKSGVLGRLRDSVGV